MNELEEHLKTLRQRRPSRAFNQQMDTLFDSALATASATTTTGMSRRWFAAGCAICLLLGLSIGRYSAPGEREDQTARVTAPPEEPPAPNVTRIEVALPDTGSPFNAHPSQPTTFFSGIQ